MFIMLDFHFASVSHDHNMAAGAPGITSSQNSIEWNSKKKKEEMFPVLSSFLRVKKKKLSQNSPQQTSSQISLAEFWSYTYA